MTTNAPKRYTTDEERKEAKRESLRRFRAKEALLKKEGCKCSKHLEEELRMTREVAQAQSDRIQELEKLLGKLTTSVNGLAQNCVQDQELKALEIALESRITTLEELRVKLPPRITK
jgi:predicted RNase H-like nuclease (RuvC/YqgF family)